MFLFHKKQWRSLCKKYTINNNIIESSKTFYISISQMSEKQLTNAANILGRNIIRIANAWAVGCPPDLLAVTFQRMILET